MALRGLIFDCDGTLAETADARRAAFNQAFREAGLDWFWGRATFAQVLASAQSGAEVEFYTRLRHPDLFDRLEGEGVFDRISRREKAICLDIFDRGAVSLRPGVARLIEEAAETGLRLAIASTRPRAELETLVYNRFGHEMLDRFAAAIGAEDLAKATPLDAYRRALGRIALPPSSVVAIDDSASGSAAAASLGMTVIATPSYYTRGQRFGAAHAVISDLGHPAAPFSMLSGPVDGAGWVTLETLARWHDWARGEGRHAA